MGFYTWHHRIWGKGLKSQINIFRVEVLSVPRENHLPESPANSKKKAHQRNSKEKKKSHSRKTIEAHLSPRHREQTGEKGRRVDLEEHNHSQSTGLQTCPSSMRQFLASRKTQHTQQTNRRNSQASKLFRVCRPRSSCYSRQMLSSPLPAFWRATPWACPLNHMTTVTHVQMRVGDSGASSNQQHSPDSLPP